MTEIDAACVNRWHDHTTIEDGEGGTLDEPIAMRCTDCGLPTHYDEAIDSFVHDDPDAPDCFLMAMAWGDFPEKGGRSPCYYRTEDAPCSGCGGPAFHAAHYSVTGGTVIVAWSCSEECGALIESARTADGHLNAAAIWRVRFGNAR